MIRSINVVAKYNNNKTVNRGLYNNDGSFFSTDSVTMLFALLDEMVANRSIKSIDVEICNSRLSDATYTYDTLNDAENDKYKFLDELNF